MAHRIEAKVMNRLTLKIVVGVIAASLVVVFAVVVWLAGDSRQAKPPDRQRWSETAQAETEKDGTRAVERKVLAEGNHRRQSQPELDSALATLNPAQAVAALKAASGGDNPGATSSSTDEVVRQLLAQRIAGGELRLPPSGTWLTADPPKVTRVGPTRAALQRTTGGSAVVGPTYLAPRTQRSESAGASGRGLTLDTGSVTTTGRRGLKPTGNKDIRLVPARPKQIKIQPAKPKKAASIKVTDSNTPRP